MWNLFTCVKDVIKGAMMLAVVSMPMVASAALITYTAAIEVYSVSDGSLLGYVSKNGVNGGAQAGYTPISSDAMQVHFTLDSAITSASGIDFLTDNAAGFAGSYPFLGLIQGRDNTDSVLQAGSYHYGYIGTTNQTPPNSTPQLVGNSYFIGPPRTSESAVWTVDINTGDVVPVWTNPDGNPASITLWTQSTGLYIGGDMAAFAARYPAPVTALTLELDILSAVAVPEPTTMVLLGTGLLGIAARARRKRRLA